MPGPFRSPRLAHSFSVGSPTASPPLRRRLPFRERDFAAVYEHALNRGGTIHRGGGQDDKVGILAGFDAAGVVGDAKRPGGVERDRAQRPLRREAVGDGDLGVLRRNREANPVREFGVSATATPDFASAATVSGRKLCVSRRGAPAIAGPQITGMARRANSEAKGPPSVAERRTTLR